MFGIGMGEMLLAALIGILVLGPERCIALAKKAGRKLNRLQREWNTTTK